MIENVSLFSDNDENQANRAGGMGAKWYQQTSCRCCSTSTLCFYFYFARALLDTDGT